MQLEKHIEGLLNARASTSDLDTESGVLKLLPRGA